MALRSEAQQPFAVRRPLRRRTLADREDWLGRLMLAPALVYVVVLVGVPFALAVALAFSSARSGSLEFSWVGWRNFLAIIPDPQFQLALWNTLRFTVISQILVTILAVTAANVLSVAFAGRRVVRFLLLLPWAAPVALAAIGWTWIFDSTFSVVNWMFLVSGVTKRWFYWFGEPTLAMIAIITVHVWRMFPFATVITLAGMTSIPQEINEAAIVDGAGYWKRLFEVTLPLLLPIITVAVLFGVVFTSTDLGVVYLLTRGGPFNSTHVLSSLAFQRGIFGGDLGQGAAVALFLLPVLVVVAVVMLRVARRTEIGS